MLMAMVAGVAAQEVLLPLAKPHVPQTKSAGTALQLPFFDDFAENDSYFAYPALERWECCGAVVSTGFAPLPPTIGMMTLDAVDSFLYPYAHASSSLYGADTVVSRPLRLDLHQPADSVALSFYYLPGGGSGNLWERIGDAPEAQDSLFVDFYCVADSQWHTVWRRGGTTVDALLQQTGRDWQYVCLMIDDSTYFDSTFRFRFRNMASIDDNGMYGARGNCDQWNIDYVLLDAGRSCVGEPEFRDVAFVRPAPSMLTRYRAMPARQYRQSDMAQHIDVTITNLYSSDLASQYGYFVLDEEGDTVYSYDGGYENAPAFLPEGNYQTAAAHATPPVGFAFEENPYARSYTVVHTVREGTGGDTHRANDTTRYTQEFGNWYAYDDGTPENGYGLTSTASRVYLAYRFDLNVPDTLTALFMCFNPTYGQESESIGFWITVWSCDEDGRPAEVLYRDSETRHPLQYPHYERYDLEHSVAVSGSIFVGFEQSGDGFINLGFDRNTNSAERIWYHTSTDWQQSILSGSLMINPAFRYLNEGIETPEVEAVAVSPNPASGMVRLTGVKEGSWVEVYDIFGRRMMSTREKTIDASAWADGVYIIRATTTDGGRCARKLIVKH